MARELVVWCEWGELTVLKYAIHERGESLTWKYYGQRHWDKVPPGTVLHKLPRSGSMLGNAVTNDEAEILTGLHMPAAMDRLREMLHECPVFAAEGAS